MLLPFWTVRTTGPVPQCGAGRKRTSFALAHTVVQEARKMPAARNLADPRVSLW